MTTVQPISFQSKQRFLSKTAQQDVKHLVGSMKLKSAVDVGEYFFSEKTLTSLNLKDNKGKNKFVFKVLRFGFDDNSAELPLQQQNIIKMGRTKLLINNETGEIIKSHKPFYKSWTKVLKKVSNYLAELRSNFYNSEKVEQKFFYIEGCTEKGADYLSKNIFFK